MVACYLVCFELIVGFTDVGLALKLVGVSLLLWVYGDLMLLIIWICFRLDFVLLVRFFE